MTALSGQKTVTTAGAAETLSTQTINGPVMVKALSSNSGAVAIGNDGTNDITSSSGLLLSAGDVVVFDFVGHLSSLFIDAETDGDGVAWLMLNV